MKALQSGPLLLMGAAVGGWLLLRSSYVAWSATGGEPPPMVIADRLPPIIMPSGPLLLPQQIYVDVDGPNPYANWQTGLAAATRGSARSAALPTVRPPVRRPFLARPAAFAGSGPLRRPSPPTEMFATLRDERVVGAQSLLLARMLAPRQLDGGRPAYLGPTLLSGGDSRAFTPAHAPEAGRWSLIAALFVRQGPARAALAPGAQLVGSQGYARLGWRADAAGTELFTRLTSAGRLGDGAEAAVGIASSRIAALPVRLVAERRQRIAGEGRSAFAVYAVGGAEAQRGDWRLQSYGAAGVVGAARRDLFAEGAATLVRPVARIGPVELAAGGGAWGATQPGANRLDLGPTLTARSDRIDGARLALDWRQRVAGNATPDSGPALTLSVDF